MIESTVKKFKEIAAILAGEENKTRRQLEKALQLREDHHSLPLPRDDYIEMVCGFVDSGVKERYPKKLKHKLAFTDGNPLKTRNLDQFNIITDPVSGTQIDPSMLLWCFGDQIREGITKAVNTWDWPAEVGLPRAERLKELALLDKRIAKLQNQLERILGVAKGEGGALASVGHIDDRHLLKRAGKIALPPK